MNEYVVVVKRAIPVQDCSIDIVTGLFSRHSSMQDMVEWANNQCQGSAVLISIEVTEPQRKDA